MSGAQARAHREFSCSVQCYLTKDVFQRIQKRADDAQLSVSSYLRVLLLQSFGGNEHADQPSAASSR